MSSAVVTSGDRVSKDRASEVRAEPANRPQSRLGLVAIAVAFIAMWLTLGRGWVIIVLALLAMLFVHELGHYLAARSTGMKVTEFFVGFGPRIWSYQRGETSYGIKALPFGAYVRIIGMNNLDEVAPSDEHRSFRHKSYPKRMFVLIAGPATHFVMALLCLWVVLATQGPVLPPSVISDDTATWSLESVSIDSAAQRAGLQPGDELISVAGMARSSFEDFAGLIGDLAGSEVSVVYRRDGTEHVTSTMVGERLSAAGAAGIVGLIENDRILAIEGIDQSGAPSYQQIWERFRDQPGRSVDVTIMDSRSGEATLVEGALLVDLADPSVATTGFFGVSPYFEPPRLGVFGSLGRSVEELGRFTSEAALALPRAFWHGFDGIFDGLRGEESVIEQVSSVQAFETQRLDTSLPDENRLLSIYDVARIGADSVENGFAGPLILLALVNVFVGLFNLLPLPPLDGGHIAVASYERIRSIGGARYQVDATRLLPVTYFVVSLLLVIGSLVLLRGIIDPIELG